MLPMPENHISIGLDISAYMPAHTAFTVALDDAAAEINY
jgi:hypothetical protein